MTNRELAKRGFPVVPPEKPWRPSVSDGFLRGAGFKIHARPDGEEPTWTRDGRFYTQSRAEEIAVREFTHLGAK